MTYRTFMSCAEPDCLAEHKADRWNATKASGEGWFQQKNGECWCPEHVPEWVPAWRKKYRGQEGSP